MVISITRKELNIYEKRTNKHLTAKQRSIIETMLTGEDKLIAITKELNRDPRGIKYEIISHRELFVRKNQKNKCVRPSL